MSQAAYVTYSMVKPRLDDEVSKLKDALTTCQPEQLVRLQERVAALRLIDTWFARGRTDTQIFDAAV